MSVLVLVSACSASEPGGGGPDAAGGGPSIDAAGRADGRPDEADASRDDCPAGLPADLGKVEPLLVDQNQTDEYYFVFASVSDEPDPVQQFAIRLYKDRGVFEGGVVPGAYTIAGQDTDYQDCDACAFLYAEKEELPYAFFVADSGVIHLESVGAELSGTVENIRLRRVDIEYDGEACEGPGDEKCGNTSCVDNRCGRQVEVGTCATLIGLLEF